mgnify:FL=1
MEWDLGMYHEDATQIKATVGKSGYYPMRVRSMDLNDELGQISHIFSDKTGACVPLLVCCSLVLSCRRAQHS